MSGTQMPAAPGRGPVGRAVRTALAGLVAVALAACSGSGAPSPSPSPAGSSEPSAQPSGTPRGEPQKVSIALNFTLQSYASPILWGIDKGFFAEEGLEVEVIPTRGGDQAFQMMNEGQVEFAISDLDPLLSQHIEGQTDAKIVYVLLDKPTMGIVSRTPLASPRDLEGKSFGTTQFSSGRSVVPFVMEANGADPSTLRVEALDFATLYPSLFEGAIDSAELHRPGSWQNIKVQAAAQGIDLHFVSLADWGLRSYSKSVIVRQALIDEREEVVAGFVRALHRSVQDALANASGEEMFELLDAADAQLPKDPTVLDYQDFKDLVETPGPVDPAVIEYVLNLIRETRDIETDLAPEDVYTNEYIPQG